MKLVVTISLQEKIHRLKHYGQLSDIDVITISSTPVHKHVGLRVYTDISPETKPLCKKNESNE